MTQGPRIRPLSRFVRSDQGAVAPMIGLMLLVLIGCVGIAIDTGRGVLVRARLVDALDAAGLAVGARLSTSDYTADARRFVEANFKAGYSGATVTDVVATPNAAKSVIALSATAEMPTAFMRLFGQDLVTVRATSEVTRSSTGLELALVLDNTGSMEDSGSMPTLKKSAKDLLDILFGGKSTADNLYVGIVPFSQTVNIGPANTLWMDPASVKGTFPIGWKGCVMARQKGYDQTDDPPAIVATENYKFQYYYYPKQGNFIEQLYYSARGGANRFCSQEILPMTNIKSKITASIDSLVATGNTHINLGAVWGWRMLSPRWRGYWGGDMALKSLPLDYGTERMSKAALIMTDGENRMSDGVYTAYGNLSEGRLNGKTGSGAAEDELDSRLSSVCSNMKAKGILIYTVAFAIRDENTKKLLEDCATSTSYYFDAGNQAALNTAFKTIGDSLSNLRVSK